MPRSGAAAPGRGPRCVGLSIAIFSAGVAGPLLRSRNGITIPLTGRRQAGHTRRRVEALAALPLPALLQDWARVRALDVDLARMPPPRVIEARVAPGSRRRRCRHPQCRHP